MSDPWTAAWAEAEASCPVDTRVFLTIELQHPGFLDGEGNPVPIRNVLDVEARSLGIESGAVFNGGTMQEFLPAAFESGRPDYAEGKVPECQIIIDNVARDLTPYLNEAVKVRANLVLIYREYREDDVSEPCYGPVEFVIRSVNITGSKVTGTARLADLANTKFPRRIYTRAEFPALIPG